ncbi:UNVERIFIED_CONTAM: hypothetical protein GTU68_007326 [Idotea baltica]|nr:hypothetical protein [Idotea baltica]
MSITAAEVNKLRKMTGAGMMDCKKALTESNGDFDAAVDYLRKKGQKVAAKRADRDATEGVVIAQTTGDHKNGVVVKISCETDFVAKNDDFINFAKSIAEDELLAKQLDGVSIADKISEQVGKIGEKIEIADYQVLGGDVVVPYIHMGYRIGVLVAMNQTIDNADEVGKDVAMQIAAMRPVAVSEDGVAQEAKDKELEIGREQAIAEGKPEQIIEKIAQGKLNKFLKESTLLNQVFVKDSSKNIKQMLNDVQDGLTVTAFKRVELG